MERIIPTLSAFWTATADLFAVDLARLSEWDMIARLALQGILFLLSAFFSGSESALFSLSRLDLQKLRRDRHKQSDNLHALLDQPRRLIISLLCGNELVQVAATANLAGIMVALYGHENAGLLTVAVLFPLILLFGEITPKTIAVANPARLSANLVAGPMTIWMRWVTPLRRIVRLVADRVTSWIVGDERPLENILGTDEFRLLIEEVAEEGVLDATERVIIDNLLEASETEIVEIMTPRTRIDFLYDHMSVAEVVEAVRTIQHPRIPVCRQRQDNLVGFIHVEDIMRLVLDDVELDSVTLDELIHPPVVAPPTKKVDEMFDFFQTNNARAAIVISEFGGVDGLVTMRDVLSWIFGEVSEGAVGQGLYQEQDADSYEVDGMMKLTDFNDLSTFGIEDPRMTTIGGVVFRYLDRLPKEGDTVDLEDGIMATVLAMDGHRLARVRLERHGQMSDESEEENGP